MWFLSSRRPEDTFLVFRQVEPPGPLHAAGSARFPAASRQASPAVPPTGGGPARPPARPAQSDAWQSVSTPSATSVLRVDVISHGVAPLHSSVEPPPFPPPLPSFPSLVHQGMLARRGWRGSRRGRAGSGRDGAAVAGASRGGAGPDRVMRGGAADVTAGRGRVGQLARVEAVPGRVGRGGVAGASQGRAGSGEAAGAGRGGARPGPCGEGWGGWRGSTRRRRNEARRGAVRRGLYGLNICDSLRLRAIGTQSRA